MAANETAFKPQGGAEALLNQIYDVKFSKHTPLVVVLLSMIYTVFRSNDYLSRMFLLPALVTWPTAIFLELLVLAASASVFIALRSCYIAELKQQDVAQARAGLVIGFLVLFIGFVALLFVAGADAWEVTKQTIPSLIMVLIQAAQMLLMLGFIVAADIDEREKLRETYADYKRELTQQSAKQCPYCFNPVSSNNRARHIASCPARLSGGE
jgi:hypothetical protein